MRLVTPLVILVALLMTVGLVQAQELTWLTHPVFVTITEDGAMLREYAELTGVTVTPATYAVDVMIEKAVMELATGSGVYDLISLSNNMWRTDLGSHVLTDLGTRIHEIPDFDDFAPGLVNAFRDEQGKLVGLPLRSGLSVLHYRADLLEELGLMPPRTIDEFIDAAQRLTQDVDGDGNIDIYGYAFMGRQGSQLVDEFETWLYAFGGSIYNEDGTKSALNSEAAIRATQLLVDLVHKYKVTPPGVLSYTSSDVQTGIQEGRIAMATLWWNYYPQFNDPSVSNVAGKVRIGYLPQDPEHGLGYGQVGAWSVFIPRNSRNVDAAWEFVKYISSTENQIRMMLNGNGPTRLSVLDSEEFVEAYGKEGAQIIKDIYARAVMPPPSPVFTETREIIAEYVSAALAQRLTPEQAMREAAQEIDALLQRRAR